MADFADEASDLSELQLEQALKRRRPELKATGYCYFCEEPMPSGHRFCDADCRDMFQRQEENGKR